MGFPRCVVGLGDTWLLACPQNYTGDPAETPSAALRPEGSASGMRAVPPSAPWPGHGLGGTSTFRPRVALCPLT